MAILTDISGTMRWHAGQPGTLLLGQGGSVQIVDRSRVTVWTSDIMHPDAVAVVVTDDGDLELLDREGIRLFNSRLGPIEALHDSAPASAINDTAYLVKTGRYRRTVTRCNDGSLQVSEQFSGWSSSRTLSPRLAHWLDQNGAILTWRRLPEKRGKVWRLCLVNGEGRLQWREMARDVPADLPPATPYPYGGHELMPGGRLRHQSLTSPNGSHTLVHQDDGNLVLYCNSAQQAVWATNTWWAGDGWADLTEDGDLVLRTIYGAQLWRAGTSGATRLVVNDDGTIALDGTSWVIDSHGDCADAGRNTGRGSTLLRGQTLQRQSLTSDDGATVFAHRDDRRLVLFGADGTWQWDQFISGAEQSYLVLDLDGMLRIRGIDGSVVEEIAGPADALVVTPRGVELRRDGKPFWHDGALIQVDGHEDFEAWMRALMDDFAYCVTLIQNIEAEAALRRLVGDSAEIHHGTWQGMQSLAAELDTDWEDAVVAAFQIGPHALLVEDNGWEALERPDLSAGTFAVTYYLSTNADSRFLVSRDGEVVADHSWDDGSIESAVPEVQAALAAMGSDKPVSAYEHDLELFSRTAGVRVTVEDVTASCFYIVDAQE